MIYKIFRANEWEELASAGHTSGAPIDVADGYIHFSTAQQVVETAARHFAGVDNLVLAAVDENALSDLLKWEPSRGGALFPHLYRELRLKDVEWCKPMPLGTEGHIFPPGIL